MNIAYEKIKNHINHHVACVYYGENMETVAVECLDCFEVITSEDKQN